MMLNRLCSLTCTCLNHVNISFLQHHLTVHLFVLVNGYALYAFNNSIPIVQAYSDIQCSVSASHLFNHLFRLLTILVETYAKWVLHIQLVSASPIWDLDVWSMIRHYGTPLGSCWWGYSVEPDWQKAVSLMSLGPDWLVLEINKQTNEGRCNFIVNVIESTSSFLSFFS